MLNKWHKVWLLVFLTLFLSATGARANTFLELESRYEGDGWFQYKLTLPVDPFWAFAEVGSLGIGVDGATGEGTIAPKWYQGQGEWLGVSFNTEYYQVRPVEYVFRVRSSYRHFKLRPHGCTMTFSLVPHHWMGSPGHGTVWAYNMVGFGNFDCLVPCPENESDGSSPVFVKRWQIIPDVKITQVMTDTNGVTGLSVAVPFEASYRIEGSQNLETWHPLMESSGAAGTNSVSSPTLANGGPFYRILVTRFNGYGLFAPGPVEATGIKEKPVEPVELKNTPQGLQVTFPSKASANYLIEFLNVKGTVLKTIRHQATAEQTVLTAPASLGVEPLIVRVLTVSSAAQ